VTHGAHTGRRRRKIPYKKDSSVNAAGPNSAINVTPLVDVCLVLLIIFMVITPMLGPGKAVVLPTLTTADAHKEGDQVFVSINSDGLWINQDLYDSRKDFIEALKVEVKVANGKATAQNYEGPILFVKADTDMNWGRARVVMEWLKELQLSGVALVVDLEELAPSK
jgi:biopolymer transport protein ExbD